MIVKSNDLIRTGSAFRLLLGSTIFPYFIWLKVFLNYLQDNVVKCCMDDQDNQSYRKAAEEILAHCDGDFVAVGASPISVLMHMASLDGSRLYTYVPFTGFWLQGNRWQDDNTYEFKRVADLEPTLIEKYQEYLHNIGLTPQYLAKTKSPVNLIDITLTGVGLASFADAILADAKSANLECEVAANIRLVSLSEYSRHMEYAETTLMWPSKSGSYHIVKQKHIGINPTLWSKIIHSRDYHRTRPRLTAEYPPEAWASLPQPAAPDNLAAYKKLAISLNLNHLVPPSS